MPVFPRRRLELLALIALTAAFLLCAGRSIGIDRHDETLYLASAPYTTLTSFYTHQSWAPLYSVWYGVLAWVVPDPLTRYFASWALLVSFLALLPALLKLPGAWIYTLPLVTLPILALGPFVSLFAACLLLSGMCLLLPRASLRGWSLSFSAWLACMLSFVVAFIRPEFEFGVLFAAGLTLLLVGGELWQARSEAGGGRRLVIAAGKIVSVLLLAGVMHAVEQRSSRENRPGVAFL